MDEDPGPTTKNLSERLSQNARRYPDRKALICHREWEGDWKAVYSTLTFRQLEDETNRYARGLSEAGIRKDMKTIFLVRPSPEFFALTVALVKIGAVIVLIDPGMGTRKLVSSLASIEAEAFVGIPLAHVLRISSPGSFRSLKIKVTVGKKWFWGGKDLRDVRSEDPTPYPQVDRKPDDMVGIFFTSGSTGPPKGVVYEHGMFDAQMRFMDSHFGYRPGDVDLATFPLFSLFDIILGITAVIPDMDATKPGEADPVKMVKAVKDNGCTSIYASPALLNNLADHCTKNRIELRTVRKVVTAGAPIRPDLLKRLHKVLPDNALVHTPYGATEVLPVSDITSRTILEHSLKKTAGGAGTCIGKPLPGNDVRIIEITDRPILKWSDGLALDTNEIGEICVKGPTVTKEYYRKPEATTAAKIPDPDGGLWHRMGDTGYIDDGGDIWFCGRKAHMVVTDKGPMYPIRCEAIFNQHPKVSRSSLVGVGPEGKQRPVIIIELKREHRRTDRKALKKELLERASMNPLTEDIRDLLYQDRFPVDIRHNAKIFREKQSVWAGRRLR
ncbi:MAG: AMP-binding protein [Candidatus Thermoplasmatota archaeon]|nr:AMP-binding protein [Candidatus Thermoplasmatota archaeon]